MARVGLHGKIENTAKYDSSVVAILAYLFDSVENTLNGQIDSTNIATGGIATANYADTSVTAAKLAPVSVTSAAVDSTVAKIATAQWTGDGTSSREINLGFRARLVIALNHTTRGLFIAWGATASALARVQVDNTGVIADGGTDFTGSSTNGFTLGSAVGGGASNTAAVIYSYLALG